MVLGAAHVTIQVTYLERNSQALSRDHCCCGKAIIITYSECAFVALGMQYTCVVLYCRLLPVSLYHVFPHYHTKGTIFGKRLLDIKCVF